MLKNIGAFFSHKTCLHFVLGTSLLLAHLFNEDAWNTGGFGQPSEMASLLALALIIYTSYGLVYRLAQIGWLYTGWWSNFTGLDEEDDLFAEQRNKRRVK